MNRSPSSGAADPATPAARDRRPAARPVVEGFEDYVIPETVPLDEPYDGLPLVIDTRPRLAVAARRLREGTGPAAIDTERASGFRYGQRAFLVQIRREGAGTLLIDPEATGSLAVIDEALRGVEWVLHAASQDLPCLRDLDMHPDALFDTELGGRIAGLRRVGLAAETEELLGFSMAKEHSAVDWSTRPLPEAWLTYAALDVEVLVQLRYAVEDLLRSQGKLDWALEEFEALRTAEAPAPRPDPWRRTSGITKVRGRRQLTALRNLWQEREEMAQTRDIAPGRLLPDSALVAVAMEMPRSVPQLLRTPGFHGRAAAKAAPRWLRAVAEARAAEELVPHSISSDALPPVKAWTIKRPAAAERLRALKPAVAERAAQLGMPTENLLVPEHLRRFSWDPPTAADTEGISRRLREIGARAWQVEQVTPVIRDALRSPRVEPGQSPGHEG